MAAKHFFDAKYRRDVTWTPILAYDPYIPLRNTLIVGIVGLRLGHPRLDRSCQAASILAAHLDSLPIWRLDLCRLDRSDDRGLLAGATGKSLRPIQSVLNHWPAEAHNQTTGAEPQS
jgi:hypothetical protein